MALNIEVVLFLLTVCCASLGQTQKVPIPSTLAPTLQVDCESFKDCTTCVEKNCTFVWTNDETTLCSSKLNKTAAEESFATDSAQCKSMEQCSSLSTCEECLSTTKNTTCEFNKKNFHCSSNFVHVPNIDDIIDQLKDCKDVTTTTVAPTTTPTTTTPTPTTTTTTPTTTTITPTTTTPTTTVTPAANTTSTETPATTMPPPTAAPSPNRRFDGPSFIGGIVLAVGCMAISFVAWKFYKARTERNYHTL